MNRTLLIALICTLAVPLIGWAEPLLSHIDVFVSGTHGYHSFRIPAIESAADGSLLAFA